MSLILIKWKDQENTDQKCKWYFWSFQKSGHTIGWNTKKEDWRTNEINNLICTKKYYKKKLTSEISETIGRNRGVKPTLFTKTETPTGCKVTVEGLGHRLFCEPHTSTGHNSYSASAFVRYNSGVCRHHVAPTDNLFHQFRCSFRPLCCFPWH